MATRAGITAAVGDFVSGYLGDRFASCECVVAFAVSFGGAAHATAVPTRGGLVPGVSGRSGGAMSVGFSGDGASRVDATSGGTSEAPLTAGPGPGAPQSGGLSGGSTGDLARTLPADVRRLVSNLIDAGNLHESGVDPLARDADLGDDRAVAVDVESTGPLDVCATVPGCAVSVAVSVGGPATATVSPATACGATTGPVTAVSVSVTGDSAADARSGRSDSCDGSADDAQSVSAISGDTGSAYGVSLTAAGPARATVRSGRLGRTTTDSDGSDDTAPEAVSLSGSTGDAAGIAIGQDGSDAAVRSGDSGDASARCVRCDLATGGAASARSGDTGSSFALAGAGEDARVRSRSGDSGDAESQSIGTTVPSNGEAPRVIGRSGDTGTAFASAVDLRTWVHVMARSGLAGKVVSLAHGAQRTKPHVGTSHPGTSSVGRGTPRTGPRPDAGLLGTGHVLADRRSPRDGTTGTHGGGSTGGVGHRSSRPGTRTEPDSLDERPAAGEPALAAEQQTSDGTPESLAVLARRADASRVSALGVGLVGLPSVALALAALVAAMTRRRRRRGRL